MTFRSLAEENDALTVVSAEQLQLDDGVMVLRHRGGLSVAQVVGSAFSAAPSTVYNFTVDSYHTYADGVLVHNK